MAEGALPKGFERPSNSGSQGSSSSSAPKRRGVDKIGISVAIGITAVALILGVGFTGILPIDLEIPSIMQPATTAPVVQQEKTTPVAHSWKATSALLDRDLMDQFDWSISTGDVESMYLDKGSSSLVVHTITPDDGELFVGLNADYIGSDDGTFFILVDNQEHEDYEQAGMDLYIDLPAGAEKVEIIGSYVIL